MANTFNEPKSVTGPGRVSWFLGSVFATLVACQPHVNNLQDTFVGNLDPHRPRTAEPPIDVTHHGAIPDDGLDDTQAILAAALTARCAGVDVLFPQGIYHFQIIDPVDGPHDRQRWSLSKPTLVDSWRFVSSGELQGKRFNCQRDTIAGVQHNLFERKALDSLDDNLRLSPIREGDFYRPPIATPPLVNEPIHVLAHWWSRFGSARFVGLPACTTYDPCAKDGKCKGPNGAWHSNWGLADYTWEWGHLTGERPTTPRVCPDGRTILVRNNGGHEVAYPEPYDPARHPLLGWYRDDDPIILDWIAYWLVQHGVRGVILAGTPSDKPWVAALFNKTRNFSQLSYVMWLPLWEWSDPWAVLDCHNNPTPGCSADALTQMGSRWKDLFQQTYFSPSHGEAAYTVQREIDGKSFRYATVYLYDIEVLRKGLGGKVVNRGGNTSWLTCSSPDCGTQEIVDLLVMTADQFRRRIKGLDGIAVMINGEIPPYLIARRPLLDVAGVILVSGGYTGVADWTPAIKDLSETYADMVQDATRSYHHVNWPDVILTVQTAGYSVHPHGSRWPWKGTTPSLFSSWLSEAGSHLKAKQATGELPFKTPTITVYNVSEWLEAGQSLQPSIKYGFGYLEAIRDFVVNW